jgi:acyl-CoA thioester hydrolase
VEVKTKINSIRKSIALITQSIYKEDKLLFQAEIKLVYLKEWKPVIIPEKYKKILNELS